MSMKFPTLVIHRKAKLANFFCQTVLPLLVMRHGLFDMGAVADRSGGGILLHHGDIERPPDTVQHIETAAGA